MASSIISVEAIKNKLIVDYIDLESNSIAAGEDVP